MAKRKRKPPHAPHDPGMVTRPGWAAMSANLTARACVECGDEFKPLVQNQVVCSKACWSVRDRRRGKARRGLWASSQKGPAYYLRLQRSRQRTSANRRALYEPISCVACHIEFMGDRRQLTCSDDCKAAWTGRLERQRNREQNARRGGRIGICDVCGVEYRGAKRTCSPACAREWKRTYRGLSRVREAQQRSKRQRRRLSTIIADVLIDRGVIERPPMSRTQRRAFNSRLLTVANRIGLINQEAVDQQLTFHSMHQPPRQCIECGESFEPLAKNQLVCGKNCYRKRKGRMRNARRHLWPSRQKTGGALTQRKGALS